MKIETKHGIYIQNQDLAYLLQHDTNFPLSFFLILQQENIDQQFKQNQQQFHYYTSPLIIDYLKTNNYIIDYNQIKDFDIEEIQELIGYINSQYQIEKRKLNRLKKIEKQNNIKLDQQIMICQNLEYKIHSLNDVLTIKQELNFPSFFDDLDIPFDFEPNKIKRKFKIIRK